MQFLLIFDIDADLIDVPKHVIDHKEELQKKFTAWIYNRNNKHKYWKCIKDDQGGSFYGVCYRGDAFVEWLNKKILKDEAVKASILKTNICECPENIPVLYF